MVLTLLVVAFAIAAGLSLLARSASERRLAVAGERLSRIPTLETALREASVRLDRAVAEKGQLAAELAATRANLEQAKGRLAEQFQLLADEVLGRHGEVLKQQNREQLEGLLVPLRDQLQAFQQNLASAHVETARDRERLSEQIRSLATQSAAMSTETKGLTRALRSESHTQGAWGEMILGSVLSASGLREGHEYVTQQSHATEEGGRLRPDVVVRLPDGRRIVIDSKVSLTAFTEHVEGDPAALGRHLASLRGHVKDLSRKGYQRATGSELDYVILFVPVEGALAAALQADARLIEFAAEHDVALATPTTLLVALRTAASIWQVERRNRNAEAIAERAGKLHDRFVAFVEELRSVGTQLDRARLAYDAALGKLAMGPGNLLRQVDLLRELGARATRELPEDLLEAEARTATQ